jgi:hypothetical protein
MDTVESTAWRKSTHSGTSGGDCVEVGDADYAVLVRDTKDHDGASLEFTAAAWRQFATSLK